MTTPREPDRFEAKGEELACAYHTVRCPDRSTLARQIAAALRDEHREALERAAQGWDGANPQARWGAVEVARKLRLLKSPAAVPRITESVTDRPRSSTEEQPPFKRTVEGSTPSGGTIPAAAPAVECVNHWHCDPAQAAHACKADRSAPCPTCYAPRSEPVAPSLLPRVLAVLDAEYRRRGGDDGGGYVGALAAELRRYIAALADSGEGK